MRSSPKPPETPTQAWRAKKGEGISPLLVMPLVSSLKLAFRPEPTSVVPFRPMRLVELPSPEPLSPPEWKSALSPMLSA
jgi:hypothetical protein